MDTNPTIDVLLIENEEMDQQEEGPEQDFSNLVEETRYKLFHEYSADPGPIGNDTDYVCPAHRWLPLVEEAAMKLAEATCCALDEVPPALKHEARMARFISDGWAAVVEKGNAPEARRLMQVRVVLLLINGLVEELANEGRPRPLPTLNVKKIQEQRSASSQALADLVPGRESRKRELK